MPTRNLTIHCQYAAFATELDWMAVCWTDEGKLACLSFDRSSRQLAAATAARGLPSTWTAVPASCKDAPDGMRQLIAELQSFAAGEHDGDFRHVPLELRDRTEFQRAVILQCQAIAPGATISYGELARRAGKPRAARAVGSVMSGNRAPLVVPCHRVVSSSGGLGGFSSRSGLQMKRRLLQLDG